MKTDRPIGGSLAHLSGLVWSLDRWTTGGFVIAVLALVGVTVVSYYFTGQLQKSAGQVARTQEVLREMEKIMPDVSALGGSERNFVNTGDEHFLAQAKENGEALHRDLAELRKITAGDNRQQQNLGHFEPLLAERIRWGGQTVAARRQHGLAGAERVIAGGVGVALSARIRDAVKEMETGEYSLLDQRQKQEAAVSKTTFLLLPLGLFLGITALSLGLFFLNTGMSQRARAEEKAARLAAIVESSDDAIISETPDGIITSWNRGAEKLFGYSAGEAVGKSIQMLFPPDRAQEESEIITRIARGEGLDHFETVRLRKDGRQLDVSVTLSPLRDEQGRIIGAAKIARDITERKQAEMKIQEQLGRQNLMHHITRAIGERQDLDSILQVVILNLKDNLLIDFSCVCAYDRPDNVLKVIHVGQKSAQIAAELGLTKQAVIPVDENGLSHCVRGGMVYEPDTCEATHPFPQRLARHGLRSMVIAPLVVESNVFGVMIVARRKPQSFVSGECEFLKQLSEHVALASHQSRLYEALQKAYDDLRQTQQAVMQQDRLRALGQMASGIAHDIGNSISPISIYTELLRETEPHLSEVGRTHLDTINRAVEDVAATVSRMRDLYRQHEPQRPLAAVNLNLLLQQVVGTTRARWSDMPQRGGVVVTMATELAPDLPAITGVESELRDALINLVFNGVDAMPEGGTLTLRTKVVAGPPDFPALRKVEVEVTDTGTGMNEETRRRCFEPFFSTKGERGTGLGLPMVYGAVERHDADIEIESAVGHGTTMRLSFPVPGTPVPGVERPVQAQAVPSHLRILVIDDDPLLIRSLRDALEKDRHLVTTASGGQEGVEAFRDALERNEPFAVVITDLGMPHMDGRKVASEIKAASSATPVILLSGWGQHLTADNAVPPHVDWVLSKPPKLHDLREALALLGRS